MRKLFKKSMPLLMAGLLLIESVIPMFATVTEKQVITSNETAQTEVIYNQESKFEVTVPKLIDLGSDKLTKYFVSVSGDISSDDVVTVVPEESFSMKDMSGGDNPKSDITAIVEQDKISWMFYEFDIVGNGEVSAQDLTAGSWRGSFWFNISLDEIATNESTPYAANFADNSWQTIATACQNNEVPETWNVGDIKTMEIDGVEYEVAIIGKNHDTYADGSGTAPLTFQLVDVLDTTYAMNSTDTNAGGWDGSALYTTLNTTIFNTLEADVKDNIKAVSKSTNLGGTDTGSNTTTAETSSDKLFLLSYKEVFDYTEDAAYKLEGTQYEYYATTANRIKTTTAGVASVWWVRSPGCIYTYTFFIVNASGSSGYIGASTVNGVAFAFCF